MQRLLFSFIVIAIVHLSCGQTIDSQAELEREKEHLRARTQAWLQAESRKDLLQSLSFISEDGVYLAADWPTLRGHAQISRYLTAAFALPMGTITGGTERVEIAASGELAYEYGRTRVPVSFSHGDTTFISHYLVVWKKESGQWKAVATSISGTR